MVPHWRAGLEGSGARSQVAEPLPPGEACVGACADVLAETCHSLLPGHTGFQWWL